LLLKRESNQSGNGESVLNLELPELIRMIKSHGKRSRDPPAVTRYK